MPRAIRTREATAARDARVFRALADPTRRRILHVLGGGEMRAGDVARRFAISRPAVSRHLGILLEAGLLSVRVQGRERLYAIVPGPLRDAAGRLRALDALWEEKMALLGEHLARSRGER